MVYALYDLTIEEVHIIDKTVEETEYTRYQNKIPLILKSYKSWFRQYELTYDEVKIIDKDFWLREEEYEKF